MPTEEIKLASCDCRVSAFSLCEASVEPLLLALLVLRTDLPKHSTKLLSMRPVLCSDIPTNYISLHGIYYLCVCVCVCALNECVFMKLTPHSQPGRRTSSRQSAHQGSRSCGLSDRHGMHQPVNTHKHTVTQFCTHGQK